MQQLRRHQLGRTILALSLLAIGSSTFGNATAQDLASNKIDPQLLTTSLKGGLQEALITVTGSVNKNVLTPHMHYLERRKVWVDHLQTTTAASQNALLSWLQKNRVEHKSYWINNTIYIKADQATLKAIAARDDVVFIYGNPQIPMRKPLVEDEVSPLATLAGAEWGVTKIRAPQVWAAGVTGQGVVIAGEDTGYQWDHPAIKGKYRGWNGTSVNHSYNWHDATHSGTASCAPNQTAPCDDNGHGTHTVGTMVGDDGAGNQVGVAPGAKWIGCRNMIGGAGTPATYTECLQWLIAPTDINGQNPDTTKAPDISSHSWGCTVSEGCTTADALKTAVENVVNAGIMVIAAAGNDGSACSTINDPPGRLDAAFTIGSTTSTDTMSSFSSRGPVAGAINVKPDVSAPGSSVRSAWNNGGWNTISGTSMATPHVAGTAALIISANPALRGHPDQVAAILRASSVTTISNTQSCGGIASTTFPNPVVGAGRIDAYAAYQRAIGSTGNTPPVANYSVSTSGLTATFTDSSTDADGSITSRAWDFGDSTFANTTNATHTYAAAGTYNVVLKVTDNAGATNSSTKAVTVSTTSGNVLANGVAKTGIAGALNSTQTFTLAVPSGATGLKFVSSGGSGDADMYVKFGAAPTTTTYDCKSTGATTAETCSITTAKAGTYYVLIKAYSAFSGMSLTGSYK
jgi:subtilisin family serine protease